MENSKVNIIISWIAAILAAIIMLQTLFFKFTAAPESVYIFSELGIEPWGRIGTGIVELIASILLFVPSLRLIGAILGIGMMTGAIFSHLTVLGIEVKDDKGYLFSLAIIVLISCVICVYLDKAKVKHLMGQVFSRKK